MIILLYNLIFILNSRKIHIYIFLSSTHPIQIYKCTIKIYRTKYIIPSGRNYQYHLIFPYHHGTWNRSISIQIISLLIIGLARNLILSGWIDRFHQLFIDNALRNTHQLEFYDRFHQDTSRYAHVQNRIRGRRDSG